MALVVGIEAAQVAQGKGAAALSNIERAILQGEQALKLLKKSVSSPALHSSL